MEARQTDRLKLGLATVWLIFTVSLASWWLIFGLSQAEALATHRMLVAEGAALIASLVLGGAALLYEIHRQRQRHQAVEEFFAAFTHDLRTSLSSLRLQVESLEVDLREEGKDHPLLDRLLNDSVRLQLQLDNSLFYANRNSGKLFIEPISLRKAVQSIAGEFADLHVSIESDRIILADARALEVVLRNLFQNALIHGRADAIDIRISDVSTSRLAVSIEDNGSGVVVDARKLGRLFFRPAKSSGTGVGLYISRRLAERMNGLLTLSRGARGLVATLELQRAA